MLVQYCDYCPTFWNSHSWLSRGHTFLVFNHLEMQWKWYAWLQFPHAGSHSSPLTWLAWHSMHWSMMWFLQMAQVSTWTSQAHKATADHFFTVKRCLVVSELLLVCLVLDLPDDLAFRWVVVFLASIFTFLLRKFWKSFFIS